MYLKKKIRADSVLSDPLLSITCVLLENRENNPFLKGRVRGVWCKLHIIYCLMSLYHNNQLLLFYSLYFVAIVYSNNMFLLGISWVLSKCGYTSCILEENVSKPHLLVVLNRGWYSFQSGVVWNGYGSWECHNYWGCYRHGVSAAQDVKYPAMDRTVPDIKNCPTPKRPHHEIL